MHGNYNLSKFELSYKAFDLVDPLASIAFAGFDSEYVFVFIRICDHAWVTAKLMP
jgi:hypothetical protein